MASIKFKQATDSDFLFAFDGSERIRSGKLTAFDLVAADSSALAYFAGVGLRYDTTDPSAQRLMGGSIGSVSLGTTTPTVFITNITLSAVRFFQLQSLGDGESLRTEIFQGADLWTGSNGADNIKAYAGADTLDGGLGNDTLAGGEGNDSLLGKDGLDILLGQHGNDTLDAGTGDDTLEGGAGADLLIGGLGNDSLDGGLQTDLVNYTDRNRVSYATAVGAVVVDLSAVTGTGDIGSGFARGAAGNDVLKHISEIRGSGFNDQLTGSSALLVEIFEGGPGNDSIDGGAITDTLAYRNSNLISYQSATGAVSVSLLSGRSSGGGGNDVLLNINQIRGSSFADRLTGSNTRVWLETFEGLTGNDTIDGLGGLDLIRYDAATGGVNVNLSLNQVTGAAGADVVRNIEGVWGSMFADRITGGNPESDSLEWFMGLGGNDFIDGGSGYDLADYQFSTSAVSALLGGFAKGAVRGDASVGIDTLVGIEGIRASNFNDQLLGSDSESVVESFEGLAGDDTVDGGAGLDRADYQSAPAPVNVSLETGLAQDGYGGLDTLRNIEFLRGSEGFDDQLWGNAQANQLDGAGGNDHLVGGAGNDTLLGGSGADFLIGGEGSDLLNGGQVSDHRRYLDANSVSYLDASGPVALDLSGVSGDGSTGRGYVVCGEARDELMNITTVYGSAFDDVFLGSSALCLEVFEGGQGNDVIDGGAMTDLLNFENSNAVSYKNATAAVQVDFFINLATKQSGTDYLRNIQQVRGSVWADTFTGSDNAVGVEIFQGDLGNDSIDGLAGLDQISFIGATAAVDVSLATGRSHGGDGDDEFLNIEGILGSAFSDTLFGGNAEQLALEFFDGAGGDDTIDGGYGYDRADYHLAASGVLAVLPGLSVGYVQGGADIGRDVLINIEGLKGSAFADQLYGSDALTVFESFEGRQGNDTLSAGLGIDRADYENAPSAVVVLLVTGRANDGYGFVDKLVGIENIRGTRLFSDNLSGDSSDNLIEGLGGHDTLFGFEGNDTLEGGDGNDLLIGGRGADHLQGGAGANCFKFTNALEMPGDRILDFKSGSDKIDLSVMDASAARTGNQAFHFISVAAFSGVAGQLRYIKAQGDVTNPSRTLLEGDFNGDKMADFQLTLVGLIDLTSTDFLL